MGIGLSRALNSIFQRTTGHNWDLALGRLTFKCDTPITRCIEGTKKKRNARKTFAMALQSDDPWEKREHLLQFDDIYESDLIADIYSKYRDYVEDDEYAVVKKSDYYGFDDDKQDQIYSRALHSWESDNQQAFNFAENIPEVTELLNDETVNALHHYFDGHFSVENMAMYRNYNLPEEIVNNTEVYSNYWHFDSRAIDAIKLFVNLNSVTEDHGPFHVISRSDSKNIFSMDWDRNTHGIPGEYVEANADIIKHTGPPGSAILANTNLCLHRAGHPEPGKHRDLLVMQLRASEEPLSQEWVGEFDPDPF